MQDVTADVIGIIAAKLPGEKRDVSRSDRLEDLGLDSFAAVEMIFDLEEKFDISIPFNSNDSKFTFETVGQVVDAIQNLVGGKS